MQDEIVQNWSIVGFAIFALLLCAALALSDNRFDVAIVCFIGAFLELGIGIIQIHIRKVV